MTKGARGLLTVLVVFSAAAGSFSCRLEGSVEAEDVRGRNAAMGQGETEIPHFEFMKTLIDNGDDLIFPSILKASDYFDAPLGTYYLYTGPHDSVPTNGYDDILLYYADAVTGPWTLYTDAQGNPEPVVTGAITGHHHTATAEAVWMEEEGKLFLYTHSPNAKTVWSESVDGIHFTPGGTAIHKSDFSHLVPYTTRSAAYSRVYEYTIPSLGNKYVMSTSVAGSGGDTDAKNICLAVSDDGRNWEVVDRILIDGGADYQVLDAAYLPYGGRHYFVYSKRSRIDPYGQPVEMYICEVGEDWDRQEDEQLFYAASSSYPELNNARGATFFSVGEELYMLYEAGEKYGAQIALARAVPGEEPPPEPLFLRLEGEELVRTADSGDPSSVKNRSGASGGRLLKYESDQAGDYAEFSVVPPGAGNYELSYRFERGSKLGTVQIFVDGVPLGGPVSGYGSGFDSVVLGRVSFPAGEGRTFRFEAVGKESASKNYYFKIDSLDLTEQL